jgi:gliding motility-associated protein GldL
MNINKSVAHTLVSVVFVLVWENKKKRRILSKKNMSSKETVKRGAWAKFMHWYESYQGKKVVGAVYSLGASVVIVGALFKIMHFPGAGIMLTVGMAIEALLFAIGCLDKPHADYHWENVFPQLMGHGADPELLAELETRPCPTLLGAGAEGGKKAADVPVIDEKAVEALKVGIANLSKTATQLNELGTVAIATNKLNEKLDAAGQAAEQFVVAGKVIGEKSAELSASYAQVTTDMQKVVAGTKTYESQVNKLSSQLNSLNAVYELQLKALQAQVDAYKAQTEKVVGASAQVDALATSVKTMVEVADAAKKNQDAYVVGAKQLAAQVADLNKVYGNMLNALS